MDVRELGGAATPIGAGVEATALRVTLATDSTGVLSIDDNGGALTVDNAGTFAVQVDGAALTALQLIDDIVNTVDAAAGAAPVGVLGLATRDDALSALTPVEGDFIGLRVDANGALWVIPSGTVTVDGSGVTQPVSAASLPLPSGAATAANQATVIGHLDGVEALLTTIDADTGSLAGCVGGTELQVDVVGALPAGTNAIGKLAANSGVDIGDVDVTSIIPGTGATNLGKAEDAAHTTGDTGVMALAVRKDADGAFGADLDYSPLQLDDNGYLKVNIKAGAGSGGTASTDDAAFTAASGSGTPIMGFVTSDAVDAGDVGVVGMDANRNLRVSIEVDNVGIGGGTQYAVDAALGATPTGTLSLAIRDDALSALTPVEGDAIGLRVDANGALWVIPSGTTAISAASLPLPTGAATETTLAAVETAVDGVEALLAGGLPAALAAGGGLKVEGVAGGVAVPISVATIPSHAVTNAGTFATQVDGAALTALQLIDDPVFADDAAFTAGVSKAMVAGAVRDDEVGSTAVTSADGDACALRVDKFGALKTTGIPDATSNVKSAVINAASGDNTIVAAIGAGVKARVLSCLIVSGGAGTCRFESGAGGTALTGIMPLVANTGFVLPYNEKGWFETADNTLLNLEATADMDGVLTYVEI